MFRSSWLAKLVSASVVLASFTLVATGQTHTAPSAHNIGSPNTVTADPAVPRPSTQPCVVSLFTDQGFNDFSSKTFNYNPPACPGPWAKVVFVGDFSITAGRQFDRTANVWIGGVNVYFGTTPEPQSTVSRTWHVESDLTDYSPIFTAPQTGRADLGNLVNGTYTGLISGSAYIQFYPVAKHQQAPRAADVVVPFSAGPTGGTVGLSTSNQQLSRTLSLPQNIERAYLDVIAQSQSGDEFWYSCVPNNLTADLQSCGATGFREVEVSVDDQPAGVAPVYPWIYTGGIDPYLWRPVVGIETLNFSPYRVDLTPFAGVLSNGSQHKVAISVFNANNYFSTTGSLLLYLDEASTSVSGAVTENTLASAPTPAVTNNISTAADGTISGSVSVTSARRFEVAGYVKTSHGKVQTSVNQEVKFSNVQHFNITNSVYVQDITQNTTVSSLTSRKGGGPPQDSFVHAAYPLVTNISLLINPDGTFSQTVNIDQQLHRDELDTVADHPVRFSVLSQSDAPNDTLLFNASGAVTGTQGQNSVEKYFYADSTGVCYSRSISADSGLLTAVNDGAGCSH
jgi:hypothetical protein